MSFLAVYSAKCKKPPQKKGEGLRFRHSPFFIQSQVETAHTTATLLNRCLSSGGRNSGGAAKPAEVMASVVFNYGDMCEEGILWPNKHPGGEYGAFSNWSYC
jgi:hypothetical protein